MLPEDLRERLKRHGQEHVLAYWDRLDETHRRHLLRDLMDLPLAQLQELYALRHHKDTLPARERILPMPHPHLDAAQRQEFAEEGRRAFGRGEVAFLLVAGGQGTRLGFDDPKGMFLIGPVSNKSLFQIHAEKVLALGERFGMPIPFLVMTSPATDHPTRQYFAHHGYFGLAADDVWFFCQGTMPVLDLAEGRLLLEHPGRLCLSPNGHGGTLTGLVESRLLDRLEARGVRTISYFQVDNPLVNLADYVFLGRHLTERAEISSKVLPKTGPKEKMGNFLLVDNRCSMIEYSDLPDDWAFETDDEGRLTFWAGNPAIHLFDVAFLRQITSETARMPWHMARKKVPHLNEHGETVTPSKENALKFERFIFDVLPQAERWTVLATPREEEFAPVKNAEGVDSPATCRRLMINQAARWLRHAGVDVPTDDQGNATVNLEISPLFALGAEEMRSKVAGLERINQDSYFG